jgi:glyoxalase family protein
LAYNIPAGSIGFWRDFLTHKEVFLLPLEHRFGVDVLPFDDPDGMRIELVASDVKADIRYWEAGPIPEAHALNGFHSVTLRLEEIESTADLLVNQMGYTYLGEEANRHRFCGRSEAFANILDIVHRPLQPEELPEEAVFGAGSIHHIAFRVPGDEVQLEYQSILRKAGYAVTPVRDRNYFRSIYYHEPGGVLFEIATETPGFAVDEPVGSLGEELKLPEWLEPTRSTIERNLAPLDLVPVERVK